MLCGCAAVSARFSEVSMNPGFSVSKFISSRRVFLWWCDVMVEIKGRKFTVILREEPEGGFSAQCVELPGAISQGEDRIQALANIKEAVEGYLEAFPEELNQLKRKRELVEITV
jgi:predicted RNase H-like HicB family nuclease